MIELENRTRKVYELVGQLPKVRHPVDPSSIPGNGIYVFFESGEQVNIDDRTVDRIVRIGTHRKDNRFRQRIRQHYGQVKSERGNKNGSIFRKHVGGALLRRIDPDHPHLPEWNHNSIKGDEAHEILVSRTLRSRFSFVAFEVPDAEERLQLESGLIALLAQRPIGHPSAEWLGHHALSPMIQTYGIWNTQRVSAAPLTYQELDRIAALTRTSVSPG